MAEHDMMTRLSQHRALGGAPVSEHEWLAAHGELRTFEIGDVITAKGEQAKTMNVMFRGHVVIWMDRGVGSHKIFEWKAGDVGGVMPYSRGASPPSDAVAEEPGEFLAVHKDLLPEMIRECPVVTAILVHAMVDRARQFTSSDLRDEKLKSLGKIAAGLAHELNNPASAVIRSAKSLTESLNTAVSATRQLAAAELTDEQFAAIEATRLMCSGSSPIRGLTAVARADRQDEISDWLVDHRVDESCAVPLGDTGVTIDGLDELASQVKGGALDASLRWIAACCAVRALSGEIETAATRIHDLVGAVKGFSYMDHAPTPEPVDIRRGITDTIMMLGAKTRAKSAHVSVEIPVDLPRAHAVGAELNQVWMNLIDNALDAVQQGGQVRVTAARELDQVVVSITDDGPGVPPEIQGRIFDPFFTTKGVGQGAGLGLDIVRRLLQRHDAGISVDSEPGRTEFQVRLPAEGELPREET
jgi:signal transduction histidine kinase